jgi:glucosamine-6-phosphate deaminase
LSPEVKPKMGNIARIGENDPSRCEISLSKSWARMYNRHVAHPVTLEQLNYGKARVTICPSLQTLASEAAEQAALLIANAIAKHGKARIVVATGNSQVEFIDALVRRKGVDWNAVEAFHMDEYVDLPSTHPSSFRYWIKNRFEDRVHPRRMNYLEGDAPDLDAELQRYTQLLNEAPIDLAFVGIGENGHIAFNDPHVAQFNDPATVKRVILDEACRRQQAGEGHFKDADSVPREAVTMTCSALLQAEAWVCCVPEVRKAEAVRKALEGPVATSCPGSIVREHPNAAIYLDESSASLLRRV